MSYKERMEAQEADWEIARKPFLEWVKRWNIGPGMNDRWYGRGDPPPDYVPPTNYTGNDGWVEEGWVPILDELAQKLVALGWDRQVSQIKEKFGGLRFYIPQTTAEMRAAIEDAEARAWQTCEMCGTYGIRRNFQDTGWIKTVCDECNDNTDS